MNRNPSSWTSGSSKPVQAWMLLTVRMQRRISSCPSRLALEHVGIFRASRLEKLRDTAWRLYSNTSVTWARSAHHTKSGHSYLWKAKENWTKPPKKLLNNVEGWSFSPRFAALFTSWVTGRKPRRWRNILSKKQLLSRCLWWSVYTGKNSCLNRDLECLKPSKSHQSFQSAIILQRNWGQRVSSASLHSFKFHIFSLWYDGDHQRTNYRIHSWFKHESMHNQQKHSMACIMPCIMPCFLNFRDCLCLAGCGNGASKEISPTGSKGRRLRKMLEQPRKPHNANMMNLMPPLKATDQQPFKKNNIIHINQHPPETVYSGISSWKTLTREAPQIWGIPPVLTLILKSFQRAPASGQTRPS